MKQLLPTNVKKIAVAVSGGVDSMALSLLLNKWVENNNVLLYAFTVDHSLRPESKNEAEKVHRWFTLLGIKHQIITLYWNEKFQKTLTTKIQETCRMARYEQLRHKCEQNQIQYLFTAHHLQDQIETFLLRFSHRSGVDGFYFFFKKKIIS
jgi:tRNA(Ile)-lysidine synthase